ncbi:hypothetical protein AX16_006216 [Volvariella volvacea WC 439]|nr:hypothetical protein AX16_006216 [Volvariella volvacea WC 439]
MNLDSDYPIHLLSNQTPPAREQCTSTAQGLEPFAEGTVNTHSPSLMKIACNSDTLQRFFDHSFNFPNPTQYEGLAAAELDALFKRSAVNPRKCGDGFGRKIEKRGRIIVEAVKKFQRERGVIVSEVKKHYTKDSVKNIKAKEEFDAMEIDYVAHHVRTNIRDEPHIAIHRLKLPLKKIHDLPQTYHDLSKSVQELLAQYDPFLGLWGNKGRLYFSINTSLYELCDEADCRVVCEVCEESQVLKMLGKMIQLEKDLTYFLLRDLAKSQRWKEMQEEGVQVQAKVDGISDTILYVGLVFPDYSMMEVMTKLLYKHWDQFPLLVNAAHSGKLLQICVPATTQMMRRLEGQYAEVKAEVAGVKAEIAEVKAEVVEVKAEVAEVKEEVAGVKAEIAEVKAEIVGMKEDIAEILRVIGKR